MSIVFLEKTRNFFEAAGRPRPASFPRCKPRPSVVKYPRSRLRAGNAREPRAPLSRAKRAASPAARAVTDPGALPVSALPRPIPDGPPPISGANKGENAFSRSDRPLPGRFGGPAGPPSCNRIARLCRAGGEFAPKAQTFLTPSAARRAGGEVGGRRNSPAEKIGAAELFRRSR